ncbi:putative ORMDL family protein [Helianthus anomalus]
MAIATVLLPNMRCQKPYFLVVTDWFTYPGVWTTYTFVIFFSWLLVLSVSGCTLGMA